MGNARPVPLRFTSSGVGWSTAAWWTHVFELICLFGFDRLCFSGKFVDLSCTVPACDCRKDDADGVSFMALERAESSGSGGRHRGLVLHLGGGVGTRWYLEISKSRAGKHPGMHLLDTRREGPLAA